MTETAGQLLGHTVPVCQWIPQDSTNPTSTAPAYPRFPNNTWCTTTYLPAGQFPTPTTSAKPLRVEDDAKTRLYTNALFPVEGLLPQGLFGATPARFLGASDYILCTDDYVVAKMPVEMKTRHNLDLRGYNFWDIYQYNDRRGIMEPDFSDQRRRFDPNFKFKKRILSQIFGETACNGLHYGILSNYSDTYFLKREETTPTTLYVSHVVQPTDTNPTLRECIYYISQLAINNNVGNRLGRDSKRRSKSSSETIASSLKRIITVGDYIGGGSFGKVFSGCYGNLCVAWKTCDAYKQQEEMKTLKHEAHIYSILKECQGRKEIKKTFTTLNVWMHSVHVKNFESIIDDYSL
ncbi:21418_t:CDS:2 [Dentiscutata erythropus]|uniref:21418_t:CDS:1 n=1 Tax=Dentiscutata erythropus TaxID=1348616 RepID=A0A9N8V9W8_9GLOM|nr:21418_t:CDS:2 [Dentiscutata erythropus]